MLGIQDVVDSSFRLLVPSMTWKKLIAVNLDSKKLIRKEDRVNLEDDLVPLKTRFIFNISAWNRYQSDLLLLFNRFPSKSLLKSFYLQNCDFRRIHSAFFVA